MREAEAGALKAWTDGYWTSADGLRLYYRDYAGPADRPPIVCLHGLTRNARDFAGLAEHSAGQWRIVVPDFRGRGRSAWDPHPENYKPPVYAADVLHLLAELRVPQAIVIGTSLGGLVAMLIAALAPQRLAAVALVDVGPELVPAGIARIGEYVGKPVAFDSWDAAASALARTHQATHPAYRAADWEDYARRVCRERDGAVVFDYDMAIAENYRAAQSAPAVDAWPYFQALAGVPLLILRGEFSDLLSAATAQAMVESHPDAELVTVPGVGHPPDLVEPAAVAGLDRLLKRVLEA